MPQLQIVEQLAYNPDLASDYDCLLASLHLVDEYNHVPDEIQEVCEADRSSFYLGMVGKAAVAMTTLIHPVVSLGHRTSIIEDVSVHRNSRGNGYCFDMLEFVEARALELGANRLELHSKDVRKEARGLYRKFGFEIINTDLFRKEL